MVAHSHKQAQVHNHYACSKKLRRHISVENTQSNCTEVGRIDNSRILICRHRNQIDNLKLIHNIPHIHINFLRKGTT